MNHDDALRLLLQSDSAPMDMGFVITIAVIVTFGFVAAVESILDALWPPKVDRP
jgi:hypothetical protein